MTAINRVVELDKLLLLILLINNYSTSDFLGDLEHRLARATGERRAGEFLFQRISLTVQRFNAVAFRGSFPASSLLTSLDAVDE